MKRMGLSMVDGRCSLETLRRHPLPLLKKSSSPHFPCGNFFPWRVEIYWSPFPKLLGIKSPSLTALLISTQPPPVTGHFIKPASVAVQATCKEA